MMRISCASISDLLRRIFAAGEQGREVVPMPIDTARQTETIYDESAQKWVRMNPKSFSDFVARPEALKACMPLSGKHCLDVGCGEGFFSRLLSANGSKSVVGIDLSSKMIEQAIMQENTRPMNISYQCGDISKKLPFREDEFDIVSAVFVFNYMTCDAMHASLLNIHRVLKPDGAFVFVVPHPFLLRTWKHVPPFYFNVGAGDYFSDRGKVFYGKIHTIDGLEYDVMNCHKTYEDYFSVLASTGFNNIGFVKELSVTSEHLTTNAHFFAGTMNQPFFSLFKVYPYKGRV